MSKMRGIPDRTLSAILRDGFKRDIATSNEVIKLQQTARRVRWAIWALVVGQVVLALAVLL